MKHIKLYENFNNQLYKIVSTKDYYNHLEKFNTEPFTKKELLSIDEALPDLSYITTDRTNYCMTIEKEKEHPAPANSMTEYTYKITKMEDEIYFMEYLKMFIPDKKIKQHNKIDDACIYMCDQFDGLLQLIKDKIY
jgi:hypothetical protein